MKCKNCKTKLKKDETVCPKCGAQVIIEKAPLWLTILLSVLGVGAVPLAIFVNGMIGLVINIVCIIVAKKKHSVIAFWINIAALIATFVFTIIYAVSLVKKAM